MSLSEDPPDVRRPDATRVLVTTRAVDGSAVAASEIAHTSARMWSEQAWPAGVLAVSWFVDVDGRRLLTWVQCRDVTGAIRSLARDAAGAADCAGPLEYVPTRRVVLRAGRPACVVVATFDVDGAGAQVRITDGILSAFDADPAAAPPGMLSTNFHASPDGSRVLNYAEWASDAEHEAFLSGAGRRTTLRITHDATGVRPIGFTRFHLYGSISATDADPSGSGRRATRRTNE